MLINNHISYSCIQSKNWLSRRLYLQLGVEVHANGSGVISRQSSKYGLPHILWCSNFIITSLCYNPQSL